MTLKVYWDDDNPEMTPDEPAWVDAAVDYYAYNLKPRDGDDVSVDEASEVVTLVARGDGLERGIVYELTLDLYVDDDGCDAVLVTKVERV